MNSPVWAPPGGDWRLLRGRKAFAATAGNGNTGFVAVFSPTGVIEVQTPIVYCSESLVSAGGGTLIFGTETTTTGIFEVTPFTATGLVAGDLWDMFSGTAAPGGALTLNAEGYTTFAITGEDIGFTVGTAAISDGQLDIFIWWRPLSSNGNLALATGMTAI